MKFRFYSLTAILLLWGMLNTSFAQHSVSNQHGSDAADSTEPALQWVSPHTPNVDEFNLTAGHSFESNRGFWGKIPQVTLSMFTLRYNRKLLTLNNRHLIEYVAELNVADKYTLTSTPRYRAGSFTGAGIAPIGFQLNLGMDNAVQPFFKSSGGFMYFSKPFPDDRGVRFNFTLELGGGVEFVIAHNFSFTVGYKYHHMSNGQFGQINPGVDSNIFYTGFTVF